MNKKKLKELFQNLTPANKRNLIVWGSVGLLIVAVILAVVSTDSGAKPSGSPSKRKKVETSILTGKDPTKVGIEQLLASQKRLEATIEDQGRQLAGLRNQMGGNGTKDRKGNQLPYPYNQSANGDDPSASADGIQTVALPNGGGSVKAPAIAPIAATQKAVDEALGTSVPASGKGRGKSGNPQVSQELPAPNIPGMPADGSTADVFGDSQAPAAIAPPPPKPSLRVLEPRSQGRVRPAEMTSSAGATYTPVASTGGRGQARGSRSEPEFYLPMGSLLSGTLLTGVDAPASGAHAKKDPFPALLRIKHEALLPNNGLLDIRDCLLIASAFADLSSERVYMRAEGISCQRGDGAIIEASIDAYASGQDGKAGVHGRVVEKTGQLVARSLVAGFVEGLAGAFKPQKANAVRVNPQPGSTQDFQYPDPSFVVGSGVLGGASEAAQRIGSIYDELAKQIVPVIEVNAGIPLDFIMTRGVTLRFKKVGEITGANARAAIQPQQGQQGRPDQVTTSLTGSMGGGFSVSPGQGTSTPAPTPTGPSNTFVGGRR